MKKFLISIIIFFTVLLIPIFFIYSPLGNNYLKNKLHEYILEKYHTENVIKRFILTPTKINIYILIPRQMKIRLKGKYSILGKININSNIYVYKIKKINLNSTFSNNIKITGNLFSKTNININSDIFNSDTEAKIILNSLNLSKIDFTSNNISNKNLLDSFSINNNLKNNIDINANIDFNKRTNGYITITSNNSPQINSNITIKDNFLTENSYIKSNIFNLKSNSSGNLNTQITSTIKFSLFDSKNNTINLAFLASQLEMIKYNFSSLQIDKIASLFNKNIYTKAKLNSHGIMFFDEEPSIKIFNSFQGEVNNDKYNFPFKTYNGLLNIIINGNNANLTFNTFSDTNFHINAKGDGNIHNLKTNLKIDIFDSYINGELILDTLNIKSIILNGQNLNTNKILHFLKYPQIIKQGSTNINYENNDLYTISKIKLNPTINNYKISPKLQDLTLTYNKIENNTIINIHNPYINIDTQNYKIAINLNDLSTLNETLNQKLQGNLIGNIKYKNDIIFGEININNNKYQINYQNNDLFIKSIDNNISKTIQTFSTYPIIDGKSNIFSKYNIKTKKGFINIEYKNIKIKDIKKLRIIKTNILDFNGSSSTIINYPIFKTKFLLKNKELNITSNNLYYNDKTKKIKGNIYFNNQKTIIRGNIYKPEIIISPKVIIDKVIKKITPDVNKLLKKEKKSNDFFNFFNF